MEVNKNSWHFKLLDFFYSTRAYDLCTYVRRLVICITALIGATILAFFVIAMLGAIIYAMSGFIVTPVTIGHYILSFVTGIVVIAFLACIVYIIIDMIESNFALIEQSKPKKQTIISEFLKSKSENYCAQIEYKD